MLHGSERLGPLATRLFAAFIETQRQQQSDCAEDESCRICRDGASRETLCGSPCACRGSVRAIHRSCLETWLSRADASRCELCGQRYRVIRTPRQGVFGSFLRWLMLPPGDGTPSSSLGSEAALMVAMAPLAALGAAALLTSAISASNEGPAVAVAVCCPALLAAALDFAILASFLLRLPDYHESWRRHRAADNVITVIFPGDTQHPNLD
ncbi:E3 ubiquitin-protein ligase MARCHF3-like [Ischnura elegans]|uniref:E3 ubiquitin-protein ligase MARCHF3-like n=1 Tax=Ischnura elegans TaxID=197161 RepID=UPI001ED89C02|nr:E3 ubiquitin-protein ligase MARCHF3-like [Ischnura elegans]